MAIVAGIEERAEGRVYNSAVWLDADGELLLRHRKINELELARGLYATGTELRVIPWRGRMAGVAICADSWRPEVTDALWLMGARVIFSPCAWAVEPGGEGTNLAWITETYRQRIGTRELTFAAANGVGPVTEGSWKGRRLQGNSLVVGPGGKVLASGAVNEEELVCWEI